jgi:hypothetical protein
MQGTQMRTATIAFLVWCVGFALMLGVTSAARAGDYPTADVALVLAADVSASMKEEEIDLQRRAYAAALTSPDVWQAIEDGPHGKILIAYFEWSGCQAAELNLGWSVVASAADLRTLAARILDAGNRATHSGTTCIGGAFQTAETLFMIAPEVAERKVLDVSGDGPENSGFGTLPPNRERLLTAGVTVNGLPIMIDPDHKDLAAYYGANVAGGPGHFVEPVNGMGDLEPALRRKLVQEIG